MGRAKTALNEIVGGVRLEIKTVREQASDEAPGRLRNGFAQGPTVHRRRLRCNTHSLRAVRCRPEEK